MKYYNSLLVLIAALFFSDSNKHNRNNDQLLDDTILSKALSAYDVRFTFTGINHSMEISLIVPLDQVVRLY